MNNKGSAYILVLIVCIIIFINLSIIISISQYQIEITEVFNSNSNNYTMATSGIQKTEDLLNRELNNSKHILYNQTSNYLINSNIEENIYYEVDSLSNKYNGDFYIYDEMIYNEFCSIAFNLSLQSLSQICNKSGSAYLYDYSVYVYDKLAKFEYNISVSITPKNNSFEVVSEAQNLNTNSFSKAYGIIEIPKTKSKIKIIPEFEWKVENTVSKYVLYSQGEVTGNRDESLCLSFQNNICVNESIMLNDNIWSAENPIIIMNNTYQQYIDISNFYIGEYAIPTLIINNTDNDIDLYSSDSNKDEFKGVVFSKGNININDIDVEGTLVSLKNINVLGDVFLKQNSNIIFDIKCRDKWIYYNVLDYLGITNFNSLTKIQTSTYTELEEILGDVKISSNSEIIYLNEGKIQYKTTQLKQVYD